MKKRIIFLGISLTICTVSIIAVVIKGGPKDKADFTSVAEVGESLTYSVTRVGRILTAVSEEDEILIGDKMHEKGMRRRLAKHVEGTPLWEYVNEVGVKISENVNRKSIPYRFHIVDTTIPNAFAAPGGAYICDFRVIGEIGVRGRACFDIRA